MSRLAQEPGQERPFAWPVVERLAQLAVLATIGAIMGWYATSSYPLPEPSTELMVTSCLIVAILATISLSAWECYRATGEGGLGCLWLGIDHAGYRVLMLGLAGLLQSWSFEDTGASALACYLIDPNRGMPIVMLGMGTIAILAEICPPGWLARSVAKDVVLESQGVDWPDVPEAVRRPLIWAKEACGVDSVRVCIVDPDVVGPGLAFGCLRKGKSAVLVLTPGAEESLTPAELRVVFAHELSHFVRRHEMKTCLVRSAVRWGAGIVAVLATMQAVESLSASPMYMRPLIGVLFWVLLQAIALPLFDPTGRHERQADRDALDATGDVAAYRSVMDHMAKLPCGSIWPAPWPDIIGPRLPTLADRLALADSWENARAQSSRGVQ